MTWRTIDPRRTKWHSANLTIARCSSSFPLSSRNRQCSNSSKSSRRKKNRALPAHRPISSAPAGFSFSPASLSHVLGVSTVRNSPMGGAEPCRARGRARETRIGAMDTLPSGEYHEANSDEFADHGGAAVLGSCATRWRRFGATTAAHPESRAGECQVHTTTYNRCGRYSRPPGACIRGSPHLSEQPARDQRGENRRIVDAWHLRVYQQQRTFGRLSRVRRGKWGQVFRHKFCDLSAGARQPQDDHHNGRNRDGRHGRVFRDPGSSAIVGISRSPSGGE